MSVADTQALNFRNFGPTRLKITNGEARAIRQYSDAGSDPGTDFLLQLGQLMGYSHVPRTRRQAEIFSV